MMKKGDIRVRASYGGHDDRLARIKAACDPEHLFRVNHTDSG